jgi:hypothetical protein
VTLRFPDIDSAQALFFRSRVPISDGAQAPGVEVVKAGLCGH